MSYPFLEALREYRGRYPVANLAGDYYAAQPSNATLGHWLAYVDDEILEDLQVKLEMMLADTGPVHAAEDLIITVRLISLVEGGSADFPPNTLLERLAWWHEANMLERLRRQGLIQMQSHLTLIPSLQEVIQVHPDLLRALANNNNVKD